MTVSMYGYDWPEKGERLTPEAAYEAGCRDARGWSVPDHIQQAIERAPDSLLAHYHEGHNDAAMWGTH